MTMPFSLTVYLIRAERQILTPTAASTVTTCVCAAVCGSIVISVSNAPGTPGAGCTVIVPNRLNAAGLAKAGAVIAVEAAMRTARSSERVKL